MSEPRGQITPQLLDMLRCPRDQSRLQLADRQLIDRINQAVESGQLLNVGGALVEQPLDGGLVREDGVLLYPVVDQIPVMLPDEAIDISTM